MSDARTQPPSCTHAATPGFGLPALVRNALNKADLDPEWLVGWPALQETVVEAIASPADAEESTDAAEKAGDHGDAGAEGTATGVLPHKGLPSLIMADNPSEVQAPPVTSTKTVMICTIGAPQTRSRDRRP